MSSKNFFYYPLLILLFGCGVKSDPIPPAGTFLPSVESHYMEIAPEKSKDEELKNDDEEESKNKKAK